MYLTEMLAVSLLTMTKQRVYYMYCAARRCKIPLFAPVVDLQVAQVPLPSQLKFSRKHRNDHCSHMCAENDEVCAYVCTVRGVSHEPS